MALFADAIVFIVNVASQCVRLAAYRRAARHVRLADVVSDLGLKCKGELEGTTGELCVRLCDDGADRPTVVTIRGARFPYALGFECTEVGNAYWGLGCPPSPTSSPDLRTQRLVAAALCCRLPAGRDYYQPVHRIAVSDGALVAELANSVAHGRLGPVLGELIALAKGLCVPGALVSALRAALSHPSARVRTEAATALGDEGREVLRALFAQQDVDDAIASKAARALGRELGLDMALALLEKSTARGWGRTAAAILEILPSFGDDRAALAIAAVLKSGDVSLAVTAAGALRQRVRREPGGPLQEIEAALVQVLEAEDIRVRTAAAEALEYVGSVASVAPLRAAMAKWLFDRTFDRAAASAIAMIQARTAGAEPGQLSLSADDAVGQLSLPEGAAGRLSAATDDT